MKDKWVPTKKEPYAPSKASDVYYTSLKRKVYPFVESIPKLNLPNMTWLKVLEWTTPLEGSVAPLPSY